MAGPHVVRFYDADLWERVRRRAIEDGLHTSAVVSRAVRQYLDGSVVGTAVPVDRAGRALIEPQPVDARGTPPAAKRRGGWTRPDLAKRNRERGRDAVTDDEGGRGSVARVDRRAERRHAGGDQPYGHDDVAGSGAAVRAGVDLPSVGPYRGGGRVKPDLGF